MILLFPFESHLHISGYAQNVDIVTINTSDFNQIVAVRLPTLMLTFNEEASGVSGCSAINGSSSEPPQAAIDNDQQYPGNP